MLYTYIYQFVQPKINDTLFQFLQCIFNYGACVVFDLEDGVQDPMNPINNASLKAEARETIFNIINTHKSFLNGKLVGIRLNSIDSIYFSEDIELLCKIRSHITWDSVFLPKIESIEHIDNCLDQLSVRQVIWKQIIPIVESKEGMKNLKTLVLGKKRTQFRKISFGHADYNLDMQNWPFFHQNSEQFWNIVYQFTNDVESAGYEYVNTPLLELSNDDLFIKTKAYLSHLCKLNYGQVTLSTRQTRLCAESKETGLLYVPTKSQLSELDKIRNAKHIIESFRKNKVPGKGFAVEYDTNVLISPQEYKAAMLFLEFINSKQNA